MAIYDVIVGKFDPKTIERYGCDHDVARRMPKSHITLRIASRFRDFQLKLRTRPNKRFI